MEPKTKNLAIEGIVRDNIDVSEMGLTLVGKEYMTPLGRIDILTADGKGNKIPIEIKIGCAGDSAVGQLLGYMKAVGAKEGIIMANEFTKRVEAVAGSYGIELYPYRFDVVMSGKSAHTSYVADDHLHEPHDHEFEFIRKYCDVETGRMIAVEVLNTVYQNWYCYNHGHPTPSTEHGFEHVIRHHCRIPLIEVDVGDNQGDNWVSGTCPCVNPMCYDGIYLKHTLGTVRVDLSYLSEHWVELKFWD